MDNAMITYIFGLVMGLIMGWGLHALWIIVRRVD